MEISVETNFVPGMELEIPNSEPKDTYWRASVKTACGNLLYLHYAGLGEDRSCDFWFDVRSNKYYNVGWCKENSKKLFPPKGI